MLAGAKTAAFSFASPKGLQEKVIKQGFEL